MVCFDFDFDGDDGGDDDDENGDGQWWLLDCRKSMQLHPNYVKPYSRMASAYMKLNKNEDAIVMYVFLLE